MRTVWASVAPTVGIVMGSTLGHFLRRTAVQRVRREYADILAELCNIDMRAHLPDAPTGYASVSLATLAMMASATFSAGQGKTRMTVYWCARPCMETQRVTASSSGSVTVD